jgi:hypothetical protein
MGQKPILLAMSAQMPNQSPKSARMSIAWIVGVTLGS